MNMNLDAMPDNSRLFIAVAYSCYCAMFAKRMLHMANLARGVDRAFGDAAERLIKMEGEVETATLKVGEKTTFIACTRCC